MRSVAALALVQCVLLAPAVFGAANCAWNGYDLSRLAGTDFRSSGAPQFRGGVCGAYTDAACTTIKAGAAMCKYSSSLPPQPTMVLAAWDDSGEWSQIDDNNPAAGVQVTFTNGKDTACAGGVTTTFKFPCSTSATATLAVTSQGTCAYTATLASSASCTGGGTPSSGGGISGGSVFLIIFFVGGFVYVVAGCVYKRKAMGASGAESCPNIDFWRTIPGLVGDGFKFTFAKLRGCCAGGNGGGNSGGDGVSYGSV